MASISRRGAGGVCRGSCPTPACTYTCRRHSAQPHAVSPKAGPKGSACSACTERAPARTRAGNLLLDGEGGVRLADFGLSRMVQQAGPLTGGLGTYQWMVGAYGLGSSWG
jgi:hypothetical protein